MDRLSHRSGSQCLRSLKACVVFQSLSTRCQWVHVATLSHHCAFWQWVDGTVVFSVAAFRESHSDGSSIPV